MVAAIEVRGFGWRYPTFVDKESDFVLRGVDLKVKDGETVAIVGRNGSGKTTLCCAMAGIIPYQAHLTPEEGRRHMRGEIRIFGKVVSLAGRGRFVCGGVAAPSVGLVMQDPESQFLTTSVRDELCLGLRFLGIPERETRKRIREALEAVGLAGLYKYIDEVHPSELSGGQKQRLIIACFLAMQPRVLILDEPTSDLDPVGKFEVIEAIMRIKKRKGMTLVVVEQDPEVVCKIADRVVLLSDGRIRASGSPLALYSDSALARRFAIARPELFEIADAAGVKPTGSVRELARRMKAKMAGRGRRSVTGSKEEIIAKLEDVAFRYDDGVVALEGAGLEIREGDFVGLIGQNGSGKTTLAQLLSGLEAATSGRVSVAGLDLSGRRNRRVVHQYVGYVFQNPDHQLFTRSVHDEIAYGLRCRGLSVGETNRKVSAMLAALGLAEKSDEDPIFLSRSEKRKLALASVLALKPSMLIADELLMGQDRGATAQIVGLLEEYNKGGGAVVLITHDMRIVAEHCNRSLVMKEGIVVYDGPTSSFFRSEKLLKSTSLKAPRSVQLSEELESMLPSGFEPELRG